MKISRYNHFFNRDGKYFVYNALTNSFAQLDIDTYDLLVRRIKLDESKTYDDYFDAATLKLLRRMKVLDVNDDTEVKRLKYKALSQRFNTNNLSLTINPTLACNFRCSYCFEDSHVPIMMDDKVEDEIIKYIKSFREVKNLFVTWFGGEPLIAFKRIKSLTSKIFELGISYNSGMITNGYLLNRRIILQLEELKINSLQITLDGRAETHNKRRFLKGGFPTYNHIIDNIKLAQELSPRTRISIRVNVDKSNAEEFIDVYRNITNFKFPNVHVYPGFVTDTTGNDCNSCLFNADDMSAFINKIYHRYGVYIPMIYPDGKISSCSVRHSSSTIIGPEGELYKCWNDIGKKDMVYGYLSKGITNKDLLFKYLMDSDNLNDAKCNECKFMPICNGGCPYVRIQEKEKGNDCSKACTIFMNNPDEFLWNHYIYRSANINS